MAIPEAPSGAATDPDELESTRDLPATAWRYLFGRALREFTRDGCMDLAAALTYRSVFAVFPALLALVSVLGLVGQAETTTNFLLDALRKYGSPEMATILTEPIKQLTHGTGAAGVAFAIGVLGAVWTASNYASAFGRAMNKIYDVEEGRPAWVLKPQMYLLTVALLLGAVLCVLILVLSGSVAKTLGDIVELGDEIIAVWSIAKWPLLVAIVVLMIASLYYFTPNVRRARFPWLSVGAAVALLALALATAGFGWYLANFGNYNKTYGSIAGVIILLLWIWIANCVLLLGGQIDAEVERAKELQTGLPSEVNLQLPPRSDIASIKRDKKLAADVVTARNLRALANPIGPEDVPPRRPLAWIAALAGIVALLVGLRRKAKEELGEDA